MHVRAAMPDAAASGKGDVLATDDGQVCDVFEASPRSIHTPRGVPPTEKFRRQIDAG